MSEMDLDPDLWADLDAERDLYERERPYWDALLADEPEVN